MCNNDIFGKIKGRLGFGCMRLPMSNDKVDINLFNSMVDAFISSGFNYFDTAHGYIDGLSELAVRECLVKRYERTDYILANKLSYWCIEKEEDILPFFNQQLECCGVDYFDYYLFHCVNKNGYAKYKNTNAFDVIKDLKRQGKIKHIGFSFHESADFLDMVLTEQPYMEFVQLQINYLDYDDPTVQSKACYDVAVKHNKKVFVMEPVKGGKLAELPSEASDALKKLGNKSDASYALSFAASFPEVRLVLSGMGNLEMVYDNIETMNNSTSLTETELDVFKKTREIIRRTKVIPCTGCNYCKDVCPSTIRISGIFSVYSKYLSAKISKNQLKNEIKVFREIDKCIKCGKCESNCPQGIKIREHIKKINEIINDNF